MLNGALNKLTEDASEAPHIVTARRIDRNITSPEIPVKAFIGSWV